VKWTEDEWWNLESLTSTFELVDGDFKHYKGDWAFTPSDSGTKIRMTLDFDLGLPLVGPLIVKLLDKIMQNNIDGMLKAIKERAESE
jgi:ribosome-associated toxin RatA of RatAB toxin-antitoxin module